MEEKKHTGTIKAVSTKNQSNGQIGFLLDNEEVWYNIQGNDEVLKTLLSVTIIKGNKIEFTMGNSGIENLKILEKAPEKKENSFSDDINLDSLLEAAHKKGLVSITTEMVQIDWEKKRAVFKATVLGDMGTEKKKYIGTFNGYGDTSDESLTNKTIQPHFVRMAETRAICRALRWYTNNAEAAEEEKQN